jgi:hypothetical protein
MASNRSHPTQDDVKRGIMAAICKLYRNDRELLQVDANERSITHKLAEYLQPEFPNWNVDCEYNRRDADPKRLLFGSWPVQADDIEAKTVFPDIIIHRRLTDQNLVVIEVKKANGLEETKDILKLEAFMDAPEYRYEYGLFLKLATDGRSELELYRGGNQHVSWTVALQGVLKELGYGG